MIAGTCSLCLAPSLASSSGKASATITAKSHAAFLRCCKRSLGSLRDHSALFVSDHRHDAHSQSIGMGHIRCHEVYACLSQTQQKVCVTRKAIQLRDH